MLSAERRNLILREVHEKKKVFVNELSRRFEVSEETIRRDLDKLDKDGYVIKGYGGAVLNEDYGTDLPFNMRCEINPGKKSQIAELAVEEIEPGDHIITYSWMHHPLQCSCRELSGKRKPTSSQ